MFESNPLTAPDTPGRDKILKSYLNPEHGVVVENNKIQKGQDHEHMQPPVADKMFFITPAPYNHKTTLFAVYTLFGLWINNAAVPSCQG